MIHRLRSILARLEKLARRRPVSAEAMRRAWAIYEETGELPAGRMGEHLAGLEAAAIGMALSVPGGLTTLSEGMARRGLGRGLISTHDLARELAIKRIEGRGAEATHATELETQIEAEAARIEAECTAPEVLLAMLFE